MNREEISEAIHDLARTPHMSTYALEHALALLDLNQLLELFDTVADHHYLTAPANEPTYARPRGSQ